MHLAVDAQRTVGAQDRGVVGQVPGKEDVPDEASAEQVFQQFNAVAFAHGDPADKLGHRQACGTERRTESRGTGRQRQGKR
ncbi:hypothetical protein D3C87_1803050 [compost metagenome]